MRRSSKLPADVNQRAAEIVRLSTEEPETEADEHPKEAEPAKTNGEEEEGGYTLEDFLNDDSLGYKTNFEGGEEKTEEIPAPATISMAEHLMSQFRLLDLTDEEFLIGEEIIGNIDEDGYLRRDLTLIVQDLNLSYGMSIPLKTAEEVLKKIQRLDPPGIGSRTLQECLITQLEVGNFDPTAKEIALKVLKDHYEEFTMKHFEDIAKKINISLGDLKKAVELIQRLNPKPGEGEFTPAENYITPDFIVQKEDGDFIVTLNDRNIPPLRINRAYREMISSPRAKKKNNLQQETKEFIRKKFEAAKWFIASLYQRRETMLRVMRAIVERQKEFFETGENLKPLIYKDIAAIVRMDISTISRVVNGKYVQTDYGVFPLRHFFSDAISTVMGEEISNKEVKKQIKEIIEAEDQRKPLSDDKIAEMLNQRGLNIARRTVAKYREQMMIPIARLRRKI